MRVAAKFERQGPLILSYVTAMKLVARAIVVYVLVRMRKSIYVPPVFLTMKPVAVA